MPRFALTLVCLLLLATPVESGPYDAYKSLNPTEKRLALRYFWQLPKVYGAAQYARQESARAWPALVGEDDPRDAYRHSLWNGSMTRRLRSRDSAERWGNAHEDWVGNPPVRKAMDLSNNHTGRERTWARRTTARGPFWIRRVQLPDDDAIAADLRAQVAAGGLVMIEEQNGVRDPQQGTLVPTRAP